MLNLHRNKVNIYLLLIPRTYTHYESFLRTKDVEKQII